MTTHSRRPIEVFSSKRRASTASTGLDYPTCYRVEEDILSRIRSLLLSRNTHCPPRTPYTSDENREYHSEHCFSTDTSDRFDFSTAKSVTRLLRRTESGGFGFPIRSRTRSRHASLRMDGAQKPTQPSISLPRRSLRATSSTNDIRSAQDDAALHADLPCCPPCPPEGTKKGFRLPRLPIILKDKPPEKIRDAKFRSCIDFTSEVSPTNESSVKDHNVPCCPPYNVPIGKRKTAKEPIPPPPPLRKPEPPRRLSGKTVKAEPADLACFLAGCGPGECKKHGRRFSQPVSPRERKSIQSNSSAKADDIAKLGLTMMAVKPFEGTKCHVNKGSGSEAAETTIRQVLSGDSKTRVPSQWSQAGTVKATDVKEPNHKLGSPLTRSPASSVFSVDVFPHVAQSQDVAARAALQQSLSSTVITNFSLSSPKPKGIQSNKFSMPGRKNSLEMAEQANRPSLPSRKNSQAAQIISPSMQNRKNSYDVLHPMEMEPVRSKFSESSLAKIPETTFPKPNLENAIAETAELLRNKESITSLKSKVKTPSLLSVASKASSTRHPLLKPSGSAEPVDTGLPVPPVLTQIATVLEDAAADAEAVKSDIFKDTGLPGPPVLKQVATVLENIAAAVETVEIETSKVTIEVENRVNDQEIPAQVGVGLEAATEPRVVDHFTSLQKAKILVNRVNDRVSESKELSREERPREESSATVIQHMVATTSEVVDPNPECNTNTEKDKPPAREPNLKSIASLQNILRSSGQQNPSNEKPDKREQRDTIGEPAKLICCPVGGTQPAQPLPPLDSANATYWGFVPVVKEVVHDAIQMAVRRAVQEIIVAPGNANQAPAAYQKPFGDSPVGPAKEADNYTGRQSLRNQGPIGNRERLEGDIGLKNSLPPDQEPLIAGSYPPIESSNTGATIQDGQEPALSPKQPPPIARKSKQGRGNASSDDLEIVPLETVDERLVENHKQGWKPLESWNGLGNKRSSGYTAIPTRKSSRNQGPNSKNQSTAESSVKGTPSRSKSRKPSMEKLTSKTNRDVRSESSLVSHPFIDNADREQEGESLLAEPTDAMDSQSSITKVRSSEKLGRKNTVHWLRDLLSSNGPYETRFTALPPRTRRDENSSTGRIRSQTSPAKPVTGLYLGATPRPDQLVQPEAPPAQYLPIDRIEGKFGQTADQLRLPEASKRDDMDLEAGRPGSTNGIAGSIPELVNQEEQNAAVTQAFAKTINDLEFLLNEALLIARRAAEREDSSLAPRLLGKAAAVLKRGQRGVGEEIRRREEASSLASMHESFGSFSSSDFEAGDDINKGKPEGTKPMKSEDEPMPQLRVKAPTDRTIEIVDSTELAESSHHEAGWPPTGRLPTPYPPASPLDVSSTESLKTPAGAGLSSVVTTSNKLGEELNAVSSPDSERGRPLEDVYNSDQVEIGDVNPFLHRESENKRNESIPQISPTKRSRATTGRRSRQAGSPVLDEFFPAKRSRATTVQRPRQEVSLVVDEASPTKRSRGQGQDLASRPLPMPTITPRGASLVKAGNRKPTETDPEVIKANFPTESPPVPTKREVREYIKAFHHPPIQQRASSLNLRREAETEQDQIDNKDQTGDTFSWQNIDPSAVEPCSQDEILDPTKSGGVAKQGSYHTRISALSKSYDGSISEAVHFDAGYTHRQHGVEGGGAGEGGIGERDAIELRDNPNPNLPQLTQRGGKSGFHPFELKGRNHVSLRGEHHKGFSFARTHKKPKIARDWAPARKRFVATVACISTALVGILVGIYAAEVPAIQYWIVDFHHYTILGNVFFFIGLSIPTFCFWPLPLLHGRKPYTLGAMSLAMPLLFPQALAVGQFRSPYVDYWRVGLILPRALMGFMLGFANMNFKSTLTDLFGASLQSENPHQEVVDENDVRRHGGGLGVWLGIWTWCAMGSIGVGFLFGALIINHLNPAWGFYVSIAIIAFVLFLNVLCPEVRRSAFRRSVAELKHDEGVSRRLGRGEVKMHMVHTGPKWWGEEFHYGIKMNAKMLRQPGFMILAVYVSWIYGQIILLVVLLGSLTSKYYKFTSPYVGASVMAVPIGAFFAIPFQKASLFSRSRGNAELEDDNAETLNKKVTLSSHLVRRAIFILVLPFAGLGYTLSSGGPPIPYIVPILFAGLIGFLSNLAMGECHGIIMETFDTSDLQPGMTGRTRNSDKSSGKRTNYSSFPRVTSGFAITQGIGYLIGAIATGVGGAAERNIGQQAATGVMAGILLVLSLLLLGVLYRFRDVQIIPSSKQDDMQKWKNARRTSAILRAEGIDEEPWRPIIIGNPTHTMRRMCILEMGGMTRWSEIRQKNHLVDSNTLESKHPNLAVIRDVEQRMKEAEREIIHNVRRSISRHSLRSGRSKRSDRSNEQASDLGGHREMLRPQGSGNESGKRQRGKSRIQE